MASGVNNIVTQGFGLTPGSVKYVVTRGLIGGQGVATDETATFVQFNDTRTHIQFNDTRAYVQFKDNRIYIRRRDTRAL